MEIIPTYFELCVSYNYCLYYIEWAYQRSRLCHKFDVTTGNICKPVYKCDVNLRLSPYIVVVDLDQLWGFNDIHEGPLHGGSLVVPMFYTLCILAGISSGSFCTPAQYEYKLVVTHVGR